MILFHFNPKDFLYYSLTTDNITFLFSLMILDQQNMHYLNVNIMLKYSNNHKNHRQILAGQICGQIVVLIMEKLVKISFILMHVLDLFIKRFYFDVFYLLNSLLMRRMNYQSHSKMFVFVAFDSFFPRDQQNFTYIINMQLIQQLQVLLNLVLIKYNLKFILSIKMSATRQSAVTLSYQQLARMKQKANLAPDYNQAQDRSKQAYMQSLVRTQKWADNPKDLKKRKQQERFRKFEKEQLQRRRVDQEQRKYQQKLKSQEIQKANEKLFMNSQKVRALNSKLLMSDTLAGREQQLQIKKYLADIDNKREQFYHEQTLEIVKKKQEEERRKKQEEKKKLKNFQKGIRKQHKQVKHKYIQQMRQDLEQGELTRLKAQAAIREQNEKQRARRDKKIQNRMEVNQINEQNKQLKARQLQKEKEEEANIQNFRKQKEIVNELTKQRQKDLVQQKIKQREQLYQVQAQKLKNLKGNQQQRLDKQKAELLQKQNQTEKQKQIQRLLLKEQYQQSLKGQVQKKNRQKQQQQQQNQKFKQTWQSKLSDIHSKQKQDEQFRKQTIKKNQKQLQRQIDQKQRKREQQIRKQFQEAQRIKANQENEEKQFKSYAQKCLNEWQGNGKNLYPIIKHLTQTMKN